MHRNVYIYFCKLKTKYTISSWWLRRKLSFRPFMIFIHFLYQYFIHYLNSVPGYSVSFNQIFALYEVGGIFRWDAQGNLRTTIVRPTARIIKKSSTHASFYLGYLSFNHECPKKWASSLKMIQYNLRCENLIKQETNEKNFCFMELANAIYSR